MKLRGTVFALLNPMGTPPPIEVKQMARRLDTLDGKTIYFVNTGFIGTDRLMAVMTDWFKANHPKTNIVIKKSAGGMTGVDKALWAEIGEKGDAVVIGLGH
jgi:ABC-type sugar transport system substrate-binding protein